MSIAIKVPPLGESITEATIASWYKNQGDFVKQGEILVSLESDKVTMEVPSPSNGILMQILKKAGENVKIDETIAILEEKQSSTIEQPKKESPTPSQVEPTKNDTLPPSVQRLVAEQKLNIEEIEGTGKRGQITKEDVIKHLEKQNNQKMQPKEEPIPVSVSNVSNVMKEVPTLKQKRELREEVVPMSRLRQKIAERLVQAQHTAAILTTFNEADMSKIMEYRQKYNELFQKKYGIKLGIMSFFVKACVTALKEFPAVNAEIRDNNIVYKYYYDIGVAVGGPRGLVVPVVRNADQLSFAEIEMEIARLANRVREGIITLEELAGGTFTISNGGIYGSMMSTPILNPPQVGILGMHNIIKRPVVVDDQIVIRPMMYLALSYDHRIIDGKEAVSFLVRVKECVENPERMLFEI
ncbi:MAG: 2-oxoglutarate dehydrogenase complex dihydrolipoyllysine-residue succinyltransferase [Leptospiraceae bacterium]|nr:2-oxoglutarate dehydrogenase complex dihydrolipoyllysine-residue succinyltransferase [Leptospiraceae bacterium]MDW7977074.1 2-oxoglutarate dehydrogenase complex dihydrolipoyllysine-residue succinyltransferase [Leptospiraceae bacterium]